MTHSDWLERVARLSATAPRDNDLTGDFQVDGTVVDPGHNTVPAAVLIALVMRDTPTVLLTQRASHLAHHAGQVSFPGGRVEPQDPHPTATALREAAEEIGLAPAQVTVLGQRPPYLTGTGFLVTPVLAQVAPPLVLTPDPQEVAAIFEVPLHLALDPACYVRRQRLWRGEWRSFYEMRYGDYLIWGATAAMLRILGEDLAAPPPLS